MITIEPVNHRNIQVWQHGQLVGWLTRDDYLVGEPRWGFKDPTGALPGTGWIYESSDECLAAVRELLADDAVGLLPADAIDAIVVVAFMQAMWDDNTGRRRDQLGAKARTRRGFARYMREEHGWAFGASDAETVEAMRKIWHTHLPAKL